QKKTIQSGDARRTPNGDGCTRLPSRPGHHPKRSFRPLRPIPTRSTAMSEPIRNRIKGHRRVRAGDLLPHELNFREHPELQRAALEALYREVGFARSLLAYELPDGRLKLLDGHLRRDLTPNMEVDVEVLDVTEDEARALLLSIDPLAQLAQTQEQLRD